MRTICKCDNCKGKELIIGISGGVNGFKTKHLGNFSTVDNWLNYYKDNRRDELVETYIDRDSFEMKFSIFCFSKIIEEINQGKKVCRSMSISNSYRFERKNLPIDNQGIIRDFFYSSQLCKKIEVQIQKSYIGGYDSYQVFHLVSSTPTGALSKYNKNLKAVPI